MKYITRLQPDIMMRMIQYKKLYKGNFYTNEGDWYAGMAVTENGVYLKQMRTYEECKHWLLGDKTEADKVQ